MDTHLLYVHRLSHVDVCEIHARDIGPERGRDWVHMDVSSLWTYGLWVQEFWEWAGGAALSANGNQMETRSTHTGAHGADQGVQDTAGGKSREHFVRALGCFCYSNGASPTPSLV